MDLAMQLIFTPMILRLMVHNKRALPRFPVESEDRERFALAQRKNKEAPARAYEFQPSG
jgi:hypothetical protein